MIRLLFRLARGTRVEQPGTHTPLSPTTLAADRVEVRLLTILHMVNGWLQYAEAKNAGVVALAVVGLSGILAYLASETHASALLLGGLLVTGFLLVMGLGVALHSFLPRTDPAKLMTKGCGTPEFTDNFYFFTDLQKYRPEQLAESIARLYDGIQDYDPSRHRSHTDLASQIILNARITAIKNDRFRVAAWLTAFALVSGVAFTVLALLF